MLRTPAVVALLSSVEVILASKSPRRKEILEQLGLSFRVVPSEFEENFRKADFPQPADYVRETALQKALEVKQRLIHEEGKPKLIISADTIVVLESEILEKPKDESDAFDILSKLSNRTHEVITSVTIVADSHRCSFEEYTQVTFTEMTPEMIQAYIDTTEPMDKAGAYGIQGIGGSFITSISGCYFNVVGFPQHHFCSQLLLIFDKLRKAHPSISDSSLKRKAASEADPLTK